MNARRTPLKGTLLALIVLAMASFTATASASPLKESYTISGFMPSSGALDNLSFSPGYGGTIPADAWNVGTVQIGAFYQYGPNPNWFPGGIYNDITYKDAPFSIEIDPANVFPGVTPGYHVSITGPASDGAIIHGVINGVLSATGKSSLVATFQSVTPNDMAALFASRVGLAYVVDPTLPNPFPFDKMVLPKSLDLTLGGFTTIEVHGVPEPGTLLLFTPLVIALAWRSRRFSTPRRRPAA